MGFADLEALLMALHDVAPGSRTVGKKFRYLQQLGFPDGANTGRGVPARYGLDQVLQTLTAFELIQAGLSPSRAVETTRASWPRLRRSYVRGWKTVVDQSQWSRREVFMCEPSLVTDEARSHDGDQGDTLALMPIPAFTVAGWAEGQDGPPRLLLVDPGRLVGALRGAIDAVTAHDEQDLDEAFQDYG